MYYNRPYSYPFNYSYSYPYGSSYTSSFNRPYFENNYKTKYDKCYKSKKCCNDLFLTTSLMRRDLSYKHNYGVNYYSPLLATTFAFPFLFPYPYY